MTIHTIPIVPGWSIEQTWEAITRGDELPIDSGTDPQWANVETDENGRFVHILTVEEG